MATTPAEAPSASDDSPAAVAVHRLREALPRLSFDLSHVEVAGWGEPWQWRDYAVTRAGRPVAEVTVYPDGRVMARRHYAVRGVLDQRAWLAICEALGAPAAAQLGGVIMAGNPA